MAAARMRFIIRNQYLLLTLAVSILALLLVQRQFAEQKRAHVERREDFLVLHERGQSKPTEHLYQLLIQDLPHMNLSSLVDDLERTAFVLQKATNPEDLVSKYHISVRNELNRRADKRLPQAADAGSTP
jgi:hypothetical protein